MDEKMIRFSNLMAGDLNDPEIQYQVGLCYLNGDGIDRSRDEALVWLRRAAEQGHEAAKKYFCAEEEPTTKTDLDEITEANLPEWCMAAEEGDADAQYRVAQYFLALGDRNGTGEAERYFAMAGEQGHAESCLYLAKQKLHSGSYAQAVELLRNAADCGLPEAASLLGECYSRGYGVEQNSEMAERYLRQGALNSGSQEMLNLAIRFATGDGVPVSTGKAMYWVQKTKDAGMTDAYEVYQARLDEIGRQKEEADKRQAEAKEEERQRMEELHAQRVKEALRQREENRKQQRKRHICAGIGGFVKRHPIISVLLVLCLIEAVFTAGKSIYNSTIGSIGLETVDAFEKIELHYLTASPYAKVEIVNNSTYPFLQEATYTATPDQYFNNGDVITVTVKYSRSAAREAGYKVKTDRKEYVVEDLPAYVTQPEQVDEASLTAMTQQAKDMVEAALADTPWYEMAEFMTGDMTAFAWNRGELVCGDPEVSNLYLLSLKDGATGQYANLYYVIYRVPVKVAYRGGSYDGYAYYTTLFHDLTVSPDGVTNVTLSEASLKDPAPSMDSVQQDYISVFKASYDVTEIPLP